MSSTLHKLLDSLKSSRSTDISFGRGIERETLRVDPDGVLARNPHPPFLGSKLCHPQITTDFSEAQLELITPVYSSAEDALANLDEVHRYVYSGLAEQLLWSASMPCVLRNDDDIPLAKYGRSNLGRLKTTYRNGLGLRYGRAMQTICAVHYNFSLSDGFWNILQDSEQNPGPIAEYRSKRYFDLMRNFRRFSWLPTYLFGASPAVCNSFVQGRPHSLEQLDEGTLYSRGATSLRNGNLGYQSDTQQGLINICFNSLSNYVSTLAEAISTGYDQYQKLGLSEGDRYLQVNTNVLQSEAEFYSSIRAKRVPPGGANFLKVLLDEGVEYIEVRLLDMNPYLPLGINEEQINFLDTFLLYCLLEESPCHDNTLCSQVQDNLNKTVYQGRKEDLQLADRDTLRSLKNWGLELVNNMSQVANLLDDTTKTNNHALSVQSQREKLNNPELTPSARILADMKQESIPFFRFAMNKSIEHKQYFQSHSLSADTLKKYKKVAEESMMQQSQIEAENKVPFAQYLKNIEAEYFNLP